MNNGKEQFEVDILKCPECKESSDSILWKESEVGCDLCGSHNALRCPKCEEDFDNVWGYEKIQRENGLLKEKKPIVIDNFNSGISD